MSEYHEPTSEAATDVTVKVRPPIRSASFQSLKRMLQGLFVLLALRRLLIFRFSHAMLGRRAFANASESIAKVPGTRGVYLRQAFYRHTLAMCGQDIYFGWNSVFSMAEAEVGDCVYIGRYCSIGFGQIGEGAMLADGVQVLSGGHEHGEGHDDVRMRDRPQTYRRVRIGQYAWIGAGAVIMADVGEGAVIGAGAVVTRAVPPRAIAVGVPARVVRTMASSHT